MRLVNSKNAIKYKQKKRQESRANESDQKSEPLKLMITRVRADDAKWLANAARKEKSKISSLRIQLLKRRR